MTDFEELLKKADLNRSQKKFCKMPAKHNVRLLAPAGSGKTFSLLWRCKYIVHTCKEKGLPEPHFLLVAFTRAAKIELEKRMESEDFSDIRATVRTLNAWGWEQIKEPGKKLIVTGKEKYDAVSHDLLTVCKKYDLIFNALNSQYSRSRNSVLIMDLIDTLKALGFTHKMSAPEFRIHIRHLKDLGLEPFMRGVEEQIFELMNVRSEDGRIKKKAISDFFSFWKKAVILLKSNNRYTLEDQKYWARIYFEEQVNANKYPQGAARYSHIMVDEFQDINPLDFVLLQAACTYHGQNKNKVALTIIGDDDQSIFGWRGTTPRYILHPDDYFGMSFDTCVLDTNYRSPRSIVEVSARLLSYNKDREPKDMRSAVKGRALIKVENKRKPLPTIEATMKLLDTLVNNKGCKSVALIGRRQVSLFPYQVLLSAENIQYHIDADIDIFEGDAMQALQSILQIVYRNKDDDVDNPAESLLTIMDRIYRYKISVKDRESLLDYLERLGSDTMPEAIDNLRKYSKPIKNCPVDQICNTVKAIISSKTVYEFMKIIEEDFRGLEKDYNKVETDTHYKEPQFFRLTEISRRYGDNFRGFYRDIEKARRAGERSRKKYAETPEEWVAETNDIAINLVTATRSKGHEYDAVIILDVNDHEWPNQMAEDIEEERRLFYVALSRARRYLYFVTSADKPDSRFLNEAGLL